MSDQHGFGADGMPRGRQAIAANVKLCASANVTVPNFLGCSPSLASKFSASAATVTQVNNAAIQSAVMVPTNGPVAAFKGRPLFTGTCTTPEFAMVTMNGGGVLEYPWAGCSYDRPGCCPFDVNVGGSLSRLVDPHFLHRATGLKKRAPVSVIVTSQLYTLKYALKPQKSGLSTGAKAGIAVGVAVAAIVGALLIAFIIHKRKLRSQGLSEGTIIGDGSFYGPTNKRSGTFSHTGSQPGQQPSELPSPTVGVPMGGGGFWLPPEASSTPPPPPIPMQELPASTHIHEHHPMFQPTEDSAPEQPPPPVPTIR
ncbi:MAG: hypothetical protein Q9224_005365, partial [Gallowayella concinna]